MKVIESKTIFSRFEDVKGGKNFDPDNEPLSNVERDLNKVGIAIRKDKDTFKDFNTVLDELSKKWGTMTDVEKSTVTKALAGTRQRENLLILMDNYKQLGELQKGVANADGNAMQKFADVKADSLDAKINDLKHSLETLYDSMMNSDSFKKILDGITRMFNGLAQSEDLKWVANQIANIISLIAQMDGSTVKTIASMAISLKVLKTAFNFSKEISALNTGLTALADASVIKGGFQQFIAVLSGMATVSKTTTTAMGVETVAVTGLSGAFTLLTTAIGDTIAASLAFIATPLGMVLTALAATIGIVVLAIDNQTKHQEKLQAQTDKNKKSFEDLSEAMKNSDKSGIQTNIKSLQEQQDKLNKLIEAKKSLENQQKTASTEPASYGGISEYGKLQSTIDGTNQKIEEQIKVLKDAGLTVDEHTGKIKELMDAQNELNNLNTVDKIKAQAKAEMDNTTLIKQHKAEFDNYLTTLKNNYEEYSKLVAVENLSTSQKQRLSQVVNTLTGQMTGLTTTIDKDGRVRIENNGLIEKQINMFNTEGVTVETLTSIRLADAKANATVQVGMTQYTYTQVKQRIQYYKQETEALLANVQAQEQAMIAAQNSDTDVANMTEWDIEHNAQHAMTQAGANNATITYLQSLIDQIDSIYSNTSGAVSYPNTDYSSQSFTPTGGDSDSTKKDPNDPSNIENLELKIDRYQNLNAAIDDVNNALAKNKTLQDQASDRDKLNLLTQEINLLNQKRTALNNLLAEQQREKAELESQLRNNGFVVDSITGLISNYQSQLQNLQNYANNQSTKDAKQNAIDNVKKIEEAIKTYMDLVHKTMATTQNDILSINTEIRKVYEDELSSVSDVESKITEVIKKQVEERKQAIEDEKNAKIKAIQEAQDAYSKQNTTEDYQQNLSNEQQKLSEIQSQIADASRDRTEQGKARLKALMDEAKAQQDAIDKMVLDRQRELNNQAFEDQKKAIEDDATAKTKNLDDTYTDQKVSQIVKQALNTGYFTDINGKMTSIKDAYIDFENRFGEGMSALGNKIKSDFISKLDEARQVMSSLSDIMNNLGISNINNVNSGIFTNASNLLSNINLNLPQITPNLTIPIPTLSSSTTNQTPSIVFNEPFMVVQGNVDSSTMPKLEQVVNDALNKFKQSLTSQLQLQGIY